MLLEAGSCTGSPDSSLRAFYEIFHCFCLFFKLEDKSTEIILLICKMKLSSPVIKFFYRIKHGDNIFRWNIRKYIMYSIKDKATTGRHDLQTLQHLFTHLIRRTVIQCTDGFYTAAPKSTICPNSFFRNSGDISTALVCTGLNTSIPASIIWGINEEIEPQEWIKVCIRLCDLT